MSSETYTEPSKTEKPVDEPAPTTGEIDIIVNGPEAAQVDAPKSRIARLLLRASGAAQSFGDKLAESSEKRQAQSDQTDVFMTYAENIDVTRNRERQETLDETKDTLKKVGRSALRLPRRTYIDAQVKVAIGREVAGDARDTVVDTFKEGRYAVVDTFKQGKEAVSNRVDAIADTAYAITDTAVEGYEQGKAFLIGEYTAAKEKFAEKKGELKEFFAARKAAALERKEARIAKRAVAREANQRLKNIEVAKWRDNKNARRTGKAALGAVLNGQEV